MTGLGELIEKLCIANIKLYDACNKKANIVKDPRSFSKEEIVRVLEIDIELCKTRGRLKSEIDRQMMGSDAVEEIKNYGT